MLAIGTAGIEVAQQLFLKCKLKANMLICLINITLESMQRWDQVVGEAMLLSGVRGRKTHYCAEAICDLARWPCGAQREARVHSLGWGRNNICILQKTFGRRSSSAQG